MKYVSITCICLTFLLIACKQIPEKPGIGGHIEGASGLTIYLIVDSLGYGKPRLADSGMIDSKGNFFLSTEGVSDPSDFVPYQIWVNGNEKRSFKILMQNSETVMIEADMENIRYPHSIEGSQNALLYNRLQRELDRYDEQRRATRKIFNTEGISEDKKEEAIELHNSLPHKQRVYCELLIDNYGDKPVAAFGVMGLLPSKSPEYYRKVETIAQQHFPELGSSISYSINNYERQQERKAKRLKKEAKEE